MTTDLQLDVRVCAVVVTRDRLALLREVLQAINAQSRPVDALIVVDNASSDGTAEFLAGQKAAVTLRLPHNEGGAGGFHEGLRAAHTEGHALAWIMDDDVIPHGNALARLLAARAAASRNDPLLLSSRVVWTDGQIHPMNAPIPAWKETDLLVDAAERRTGLVPIRAATFTSLLVDRRAIDRYGLPEKRFFLWSDDLEYTARILRAERGFLVTDSVVLHKTATAHTAMSGPPDRYYFHVRNTVYMLRGSAWRPLEKVSHARMLARSIPSFLRQERFRPRAVGIVSRGLFDGVFGASRPSGPYLRP